MHVPPAVCCWVGCWFRRRGRGGTSLARLQAPGANRRNGDGASAGRSARQTRDEGSGRERGGGDVTRVVSIRLPTDDATALDGHW
jgi:hypothetical protein